MWQVGTQLVVTHCGDTGHCNSISTMLQSLDTIEQHKDASFAKSLLPEVTELNGSANLESLPTAAAQRPTDEIPNLDGARLVDLGNEGEDVEDPYDTDDSEEEDEEDAEYRNPSIPISSFPKTDEFANRFVTVIHTNGVHHLPLIACACKEETSGRDHFLMDLVYSSLYPASLKVVSTLFMEAVISDY